jgi:hypothetical protein
MEVTPSNLREQSVWAQVNWLFMYGGQAAHMTQSSNRPAFNLKPLLNPTGLYVNETNTAPPEAIKLVLLNPEPQVGQQVA